ncbi:GDSL esterase/lipase [Forsythia ovata]|uniref:GDSL esterase/lipase n=1 Tax=Forsythia ovata TaxID=205694 RepID=A0ABD1VH82_9LAMI
MCGHSTFGMCTSNTFRRRNDDRRGCSDEVNMLVLEYNTMLEEKIVALNEELSDGHIIFLDVYRAIIGVQSTILKTMELRTVRDACCGLGKYHGMSGCLSTDMACDQSSTYVWWDLYNPTPAMNSLVANSAWSGRSVGCYMPPHYCPRAGVLFSVRTSTLCKAANGYFLSIHHTLCFPREQAEI